MKIAMIQINVSLFQKFKKLIIFYHTCVFAPVLSNMMQRESPTQLGNPFIR
jgi:hypothetical protein